MGKRGRRSQASVIRQMSAVSRPAAAPPPATPLLKLPAALLDDISNRVMQLGAGNELSLTCRACSLANLLHAPAFRILLDRQRCDQLLTPRVVSALQARSRKLALSLEQPLGQDSEQHTDMLAHTLDKLGRCVAVEACKLCAPGELHSRPSYVLTSTSGLAQLLVASFPSLTTLSIHGYSASCRDLASLLSYPQLALQLQQLDLPRSCIIQEPQQPAQPGEVTLGNLFRGLRLHTLSLEVSSESPLPNLQPLAQHLTQLHISQSWDRAQSFVALASVLLSLPQLQVLTLSHSSSFHYQYQTLPQLLQVLPRLHTLQLPDASVMGPQQLSALLAATQLTSRMLTCSLQQLELAGFTDCKCVAHLPLHSLTQPLVIGRLVVNAAEDKEVAAAVRNLTQACKVQVQIKSMEFNCFSEREAAAEAIAVAPSPAFLHRRIKQLAASLEPLQSCIAGQEVVFVSLNGLNAVTVPALAPLCQGSSRIQFLYGSLSPSLEFWRQLVQLMPTEPKHHIPFLPIVPASTPREQAQLPTTTSQHLHTSLLLDMPRVPKHTRANRANGAKTQARHEAAKSMEQLTAAHATLTAAHAALNADLLSSRELYSQLREWHRSLLVTAGQRDQQWELDLLGFMQQVTQLEEAFLQQLQGAQAQLTDTAAALEAAQKDLAAFELAHTTVSMVLSLHTPQSRWGSYVDACSSLTRVLKPVTAAVTGIMKRQGKAAPAWAGDLCSLLLDTDLICKLMVVAVVGQQLVMPDLGWVATEGGMHAFELARHVEQLLDNLLDASTQDAEERFPYIFQHAQGLFVAPAPSAHTAAGSLLTAAASAPNHMALEGPQQWAAAKPKLVVLINKHIQALYEYLYEHSQLFFQLPHLLAAMGSSNALYAQKAAEQVLKQRDMRLQEWDVHKQQKQQQQQGGRRQPPSGQQFLPFDPAVFDPYGTLQDFLVSVVMSRNDVATQRRLRTYAYALATLNKAHN
ncbi:hypothetical protein QJQ45_008819 [Haematococcus lacustris]|nr:hypothetical protein QJQ45_008819 [Haematococcus lacustris]